MIEDNTPTVTARRRKPTGHMRLRLDTIKRLRALGAQKRAAKDKTTEGKADATGQPDRAAAILPRKPKLKKQPTLAKPPTPKARFRKRQIHKSWLPTHLFHTKRAHMTPPSAPLWRFSIPLTPTQKSYRPTHRAANERGAVAWDMSYMATIALEGREDSIESVLRRLGVDLAQGGAKWKNGTRCREVWIYGRDSKLPIAPVTIIWCASSTAEMQPLSTKRTLFLRMHSSAFTQTWEEVLKMARTAKPAVTVEDLRFEIGSIDITGPGSTEALLAALWPTQTPTDEASVKKTWASLLGLTNPASLPAGAMLAFDLQDPRLHHPPRTVQPPTSPQEYDNLLRLIAEWPVDRLLTNPAIFDRIARQKGSRLPSQKAINRRKSLATPGAYPEAIATDPAIPILLYTTPDSDRRTQSTWTLLAPWKTIQPIWYSIQYYPLSTGHQPRFGGLNEKRQLAFERGTAWFPADYPGTDAGWEWEMQERRVRMEEWKKRPKAKRVSWERVDLGGERRGEVGDGLACDWSLLLRGEEAAVAREEGQATTRPEGLAHLPPAHARELLSNAASTSPSPIDGKLATIRLILITRGVPQTCARIYRLPRTDTALRKSWLALLEKPNGNHTHRLPTTITLPKDAPPHLLQRRLAQSLLHTPQAGEETYPSCPGEEDLIGFVTTGNFNLAEGKGTGMGCVMLVKVLEDVRSGEDEVGRLCVVRNSGEGIARLGRWEVV